MSTPGAAPARSRHAGLTLIELLVVLVLTMVLLGLAAPAFQQSLQRMRLQAATNDLLAAIELTRSQAMARGAQVLMVPLDLAGTNWQNGWVVFQDRNGNRRPDAGEAIIHRHDALRADVSIHSRFTSGDSPAYVAYNAAGRSCRAGNGLAARWGSLSLRQGEHTRNIIINMLGRARACNPVAERGACDSAGD